MTTLRFVLGDQLSLKLSALDGADPAKDVILMAEVAEEAAYVRHHKKKLAFIFAAMRAFAGELRALGFRVLYFPLDADDPCTSFDEALARAVKREKPSRVVTTEASEWRVLEMQRRWAQEISPATEIRADTRFLCTHADFAAWADGRKQLRMEYFYREMRRRYDLLMDGDAPTGGQWNYDAENRKPAKGDLFMPQPPRFAPSAETQAALAMVAAQFPDNFGDLEPFWFAVTRAEAEAAADHFFKACLPSFGDHQDAMLRAEKFLYHAVLSMYLNVGLLDALSLCRRAEAEYRAGRAPLNAVEGFIRQILGWREYVRGIYWLHMPGYTARNALGANRPLPEFYWTGETTMACIKAVVQQTKEEAYAHHIQRLMVTGNFALIAGIDPAEVHAWYLSVYADAFEWVEAPNTIGMSQFADGGALASKPYAASGAYIDRMSDYCAGCAYSVKEKTGPKACPFNYLYWDFIARHAALLKANPRVGQIVRSYEKMDSGKKAAIAESAAAFLKSIA